MKLSIIIVSYNVKYYLEQCLRSVLHAAQGIDTEIFVVDNCSSDGSVTYLRERFSQPNIHILANRDNVGFGKANNQALLRAQGQYVLFLNPDTILSPSTLTDCLLFAERTANIGAVGVRMLKADGTFALESRRGLPTPFTCFCKISGLGKLFPKSKCFGKYYMRYLDERQINEIDIVSGAFMMIPRQVLQEVGAFDERFFMYAEDTDLSYRIQLAGYHNYYVPTPIIHYKGESTAKNSYRYVYIFHEAMLIFFKKHYPHARLWLSLPIKLAIYLQAGLSITRRWLPLKKWCARGKSILYCCFTTEDGRKDVEVIAQREALDLIFVNHSDWEKMPPNTVLATYDPETQLLITQNTIYHL